MLGGRSTGASGARRRSITPSASSWLRRRVKIVGDASGTPRCSSETRRARSQIADDQRRPPLAKQLGRLRDGTELAIGLRSTCSVSLGSVAAVRQLYTSWSRHDTTPVLLMRPSRPQQLGGIPVPGLSTISDHHLAAAEMWAWAAVPTTTSARDLGCLAHAAQRLNARPDQAILDVATGTGWSARNVARRGARVTAVDISAELLAAAEDLSRHIRPPIHFVQADAEGLPFASGSFDGVISTFGLMFAFDQAKASAELAEFAATAAGWSSPRGCRTERSPSSSASSPVKARRRPRPHRRSSRRSGCGPAITRRGFPAPVRARREPRLPRRPR